MRRKKLLEVDRLENFDPRRYVNPLILFLSLVAATLQISELGGQGSIFNSILFLLVGSYILINCKFDRSLVIFFVSPLVFLCAGVVLNSQDLHRGSYNSAMLIVVAYLIIALSREVMSLVLLRVFVFLYLVGSLLVSVYTLVYVEGFNVFAANPNFNVNPAAAGQFFFVCLGLSLVFIDSVVKWFFVGSYFWLVVTTNSRTSLVISLFAILSYLIIEIVFSGRFSIKKIYSSLGVCNLKNWYVIPGVVFFGFVLFSNQYVVGKFGTLFYRFCNASTVRQDYLWEIGIDHSLSSVQNILFGSGPATMLMHTDVAVHSAYIDAAGSLGYPFLVLSLLALGMVLLRMMLMGHKHLMWVLGCVLVDGIGTTGIFGGLPFMWLFLVLCIRYWRGMGEGKSRVEVSRQIGEGSGGLSVENNR